MSFYEMQTTVTTKHSFKELGISNSEQDILVRSKVFFTLYVATKDIAKHIEIDDFTILDTQYSYRLSETNHTNIINNNETSLEIIEAAILETLENLIL